MEKVVGLLLESSVRAGDYKSVRAVRRPSAVGVGQIVRRKFNASFWIAAEITRIRAPRLGRSSPTARWQIKSCKPE